MAETRYNLEVLLEGPTLRLRRCGPGDEAPLITFCDIHMRKDWFCRAGQWKGLLEQPYTQVYAVLFDDMMIGIVAIYRETTLNNLYIASEFRGRGVGKAILDALRPTYVRAKTNMSSGDPTEFYRNNGFTVDQADPDRPHIKVMKLERDAARAKRKRSRAAKLAAKARRHNREAASLAAVNGEAVQKESAS